MRRLLLFVCLLCTYHFAQAQLEIDECVDQSEITLASFCDDACVICNIDGYTGNNSLPGLGEAPPGFCAGQLHNTQWVGFVANSTSITMDISVFNCTIDQNGDGTNEGLQIGIYNTTDCNNFNLVSNCDDQVFDNTTQSFTANGLTVGGIYFIVLDGAFGDVCDFTIDVTAGSVDAPDVDQVLPNIDAELEVCQGGLLNVDVDDVFGAGAYIWTLDGEQVATDQQTSIQFPQDVGTYTLCVFPYNPCSDGLESCVDVEVVPPVQEPFPQTICEGEVYTIAQEDYDTEGNFDIVIPVDGDCDILYELQLTVIPIAETFLVEEICFNDFFVVGNEEFNETGSYEEVLVSPWSGCDSIVYLDLTVVGTEGTTLLVESICEGDTYAIGGDLLDEAGSYFYELIDEVGCDSFVDLFLEVFPRPSSLTEVAICAGESYSFNNSNYSSTGMYEVIIPLPTGCDSAAVLDLEVIDSYTEAISADICDGESFTVGTSDFTTSGVYNVDLIAANGCDSTVTLTLNVQEVIIETASASICDGETFTVDGNNFTTAGTYDLPYTAANGCDSIYRLTLAVLPNSVQTINPGICGGETFSFGGNDYTTTGTYNVTLPSANGCDSITTINLTVSNEITSTENISLCAGESLTIQGQTITTSGSYDFPYVSAGGCDSLATVIVDVGNAIETNLAENICQGLSYTVGTQTFDMTGMYTVVLTAQNGCDSTVNLNLTVDPPVPSLTEISICQGQTYDFNGQILSTSGSYTANLTSPAGCDSIANLELTVNPPVPSQTNISICQGQTYDFNGQLLNTSGSYTANLTSPAGCDSIANLELTVLPPPVSDNEVTICEGEVYNFNGQVLTTSGIYTAQLTTSAGCDSIANLELNVTQTIETTINPLICTGTSFSIGGDELTDAGQYMYSFTSAAGCDSVVTVNLQVDDAIFTILDETICEGESYLVGGNNYTMTGDYEDSFVTPEGCDSIVQLALTVIPTVFSNLTERICAGETFTAGGMDFTTSGTYTVTVDAASGCDSVITLNLTVVNIPNTPVMASICDTGSYTVGDSTFTVAGQYTVDLLSQDGCDSTIVLDLIVTDFYETNLNVNLCDGESYTVGTSTYDMTGTYQDNFLSQDGCDSIVNLNLTVNPILQTTLDEELCQGESFSIAGVPYSTTGQHTETIASQVTGCDSVITLNLIVHPNENVSISETICAGESVMVGDSTYTTTGSFFTPLTTQFGCDSIVSLNLTVNPIPETFLTEVICEGNSVMVGTSTYLVTGGYTDVLTSVVTGCDSIVYLDLTVNPLLETQLTEVICEGESVTIAGVDYTTTGIHQEIISSVVTGCDSTIILDLTVNPVYDQMIEATICDGESVMVGDSAYTSTGIWPTLMSTAAGCDSLVTLDLEVLPILTTDLQATLCAGEVYNVGAEVFDETGTYTVVLTSSFDCDSIVNLDLTVLDVIETFLVEEICDDSDYTVGNETFDATGEYTIPLVSPATGCDSTVYLALTVNPTFNITLDEEICSDQVFTVGGMDFNQTGTYQVDLTTAAGCDSIVNLNLLVFPCAIDYGTSFTDNDCNGGENGRISFSIFVGTPPYSYTWNATAGPQTGSGTIDANNEEVTLTGLPAGPYEIVVTDANGIEATINSTVGQPAAMNLQLEASSYGLYELSCPEATDGSLSASVAGGTAPYSYLWSNGVTSALNDDLAAASYEVTVTDANGCTIIATEALTAPAPLTASLQVNSPPCFEDLNGTINVPSVQGGSGPYLYAIDGGAYTPSPTFGSVSIGNHLISVQDINGCTWETTATVEQAPELTVAIGFSYSNDEESIKYGESLPLFADASGNIVKYEWEGEIEDCGTCDTMSVTARPLESGPYSVTVTDENGCTATDRVIVMVRKDRGVYFPNAFSPNEDGTNDLFMMFTDNDVVSINSFYVFNRWGESVWEQVGTFAPNNVDIGWDGRHRGELVNAGVYVYMAEITFSDGETLIYKGDVVLMR